MLGARPAASGRLGFECGPGSPEGRRVSSRDTRSGHVSVKRVAATVTSSNCISTRQRGCARGAYQIALGQLTDCTNALEARGTGSYAVQPYVSVKGRALLSNTTDGVLRRMLDGESAIWEQIESRIRVDCNEGIKAQRSNKEGGEGKQKEEPGVSPGGKSVGSSDGFPRAQTCFWRMHRDQKTHPWSDMHTPGLVGSSMYYVPF